MQTLTIFDGPRRVASGTLADVLGAILPAHAAQRPLLVLDDASARVVDLDLRGTPEAILARHAPAPVAPEEARPRGRPRLGVTAREVTLLPRHWDWLASQPGGASAALRRLIDTARRTSAPEDAIRAARETTFRAMQVLAGDLPGFEEALRRLYAGDEAGFAAAISAWPQDLRDYVRNRAQGAWGAEA